MIMGMLICFLIAGCGKADSGTTVETPDDSTVEADTKETFPETGSESEAESRKNDASEKKSLAERMAGKYSYHSSGDNGEEEYYVLDVVNFGDNLCAFCGQAIPDDNGNYEVYSFWASEFIPYDADELSGTDGDQADVNQLCFSIMSNVGEYWNSGHFGTITLTDEGLVFDGFAHDGFLVPQNGDSRLFLKDERVEDAFSYLKHDDAGDNDLQGVWVQDNGDADLYMEFSGSDLYMYQKNPGREVFFAAGGCDFHDGSFDLRGNMIQNGGMPFELSGDYKVDGDTLTIELTGDDKPVQLPDSAKLSRISKHAVHVTTMDEVVFGADSFGYEGQLANEPFFGLWVEAFRDRADAEDLVAKLDEKDLPASYVFSCDWENLNKDPYYCVTIGRSGSEPEAQSYIEKAKKEGYGSAYVKYTGDRIGHRADYTVFDETKIIISPKKAVIRAAALDDLSGGETVDATLIVDGDTVFDKTCDMQFFSYYKDGSTPLEWFNDIARIRDTEEYREQVGALTGVFEVDVTGNHIDRFYGCYWWD